jgi:hypothetical protein
MLQHKGGHHEGGLSGEFGLGALQLAHAFAFNAGPIVLGIAPTVVASVTVTPKVSGKFAIRANVNVNNTDTGAAHHAALQVMIDAAPPFPALPAAITVDASGNASLGLEVESDGSLPSLPVEPTGVPVTISLLVTADIAALLGVAAQNGQLSVEELPN